MNLCLYGFLKYLYQFIFFDLLKICYNKMQFKQRKEILMNRKTKAKILLGAFVTSGVLSLISSTTLPQAMVNDDDPPAATATASTHDDTSSDPEEKKFYYDFETLNKTMHPEIMGFTYDPEWYCKVKKLTEFKVYADTPLLYSIWSHDRFPSMFQKLIDQGVDVNEPDSSGFSPLHIAIIAKKYNLAEILVKNGANVNAVSPQRTYTHIPPQTK